MRLKKPGKRISNPEILNLSPFGLWLHVQDKEYFLSFDQYPWFRTATVESVYNLKLIHDHHLHWPALDIDLDLDSLDYPEKYPLVYS